MLYHETYLQHIMIYLAVMGIEMYAPPDVAGYPAYFQGPAYNRNWITSTSLAYRYSLIYPVLQGIQNQNQQLLLQLDTVAWVEDPSNISDPSDPAVIVEELTGNIMAVEISEERYEFFLYEILLANYPPEMWTQVWEYYQVSGDDSIVRGQLDSLVWSIMQAPEFQMF